MRGTPFREPAERWVRNAVARSPVEEVPVTHEAAFASRALKTRHRDPVDRFLAAPAQVFDFTLVTADADLLRLKSVRTLSTR